MPVESRGGAELAQAAKLGFSQLLVRVSGNESILEQTAFQEAVNNETVELLQMLHDGRCRKRLDRRFTQTDG